MQILTQQHWETCTKMGGTESRASSALPCSSIWCVRVRECVSALVRASDFWNWQSKARDRRELIKRELDALEVLFCNSPHTQPPPPLFACSRAHKLHGNSAINFSICICIVVLSKIVRLPLTHTHRFATHRQKCSRSSSEARS